MWSTSWLIRPLVADRSAKQVITHLTKCDLRHDWLDHWWLMFCTVWVCSTELFFAAWWDLLVFAADSVLRQQVLCVHVKLWIRHLHVTVLITSLWPSCDTPRLRFKKKKKKFNAAKCMTVGHLFRNIHPLLQYPSHSSTRLCMIHFFTCSSCTILFPPWSQVSGIWSATGSSLGLPGSCGLWKVWVRWSVPWKYMESE